MDLSRRGFLQAAVLTAAASGLTVACGGGSDPAAPRTARTWTLWYWCGGLSDKVVADAKTHFTAEIKPQDLHDRRRLQAPSCITTPARPAHPSPDITGIKGEDIASFLPNADRFIDLKTVGAEKLGPAVPGVEVEAGHQPRTAS